MKRKTKRIFSLLLALAVMATMLTALPLLGYASTYTDLMPIPASASPIYMQDYGSSGIAKAALTSDGYFVASGGNAVQLASTYPCKVNGNDYYGWRVKGLSLIHI